MSSTLRFTAQPASQRLHLNHSDNGYKYADILARALNYNAQQIGSMFLFPAYTELQDCINSLESDYQFNIKGYRTHLNGGKKIYFGIQGKESNIVVFNLIKITAGENLGYMLYVVSETNMNESVTYNDNIDDDLNDLEASAAS